MLGQATVDGVTNDLEARPTTLRGMDATRSTRPWTFQDARGHQWSCVVERVRPG
jgi:hypothetical protein